MNGDIMKGDGGLSGSTHEIQTRSGDNKSCLLWCSDGLFVDPMIREGDSALLMRIDWFV